MCTYILSGTPSKVNTAKITTACLEYGGICDSDFVQLRREFHCTKYKERMTRTVTIVDLCVVPKHSCT